MDPAGARQPRREFEAAWLADARPRLEEYLSQDPGADRAAVLGELLAVELYHRVRLGEWPTPDDYLPRFPEHTALVRSLFARAGQSGVQTLYTSTDTPDPLSSLETNFS